MKTTLEHYHPSLKKVFAGVDRWLERSRRDNDLERYTSKLNYDFTESLISRGASTWIQGFGRFYGNLACSIFGKNDLENIAQPLRWSVAFKSLAFRFEAAVPHPTSETMLPLPFWSSMKASGPAMLSQWEEAKTCAQFLIQVAEKNQSLKTDKGRADGWGKGTNDAFLVALFCEAFALKTVYYPVNPIIPEYQGVLDYWKTTNQETYRQVMQAAAEFHISRSKGSTNKVTYEFDDLFDSIFPAELLAVQALRRRDGLPEFETGHLLIDTPWAVIRDLPEVEPHPLIAIVEARIKHDYPAFR
jgi:hypothetical protein